jgi:cytochrome P450
VVLSDGTDHARRRGLIRPAVAPRSTDGYLATMSGAADEALDELDPATPFDAYAVFRRAIRRSTLRVLFGEDMARHADELGATLQPLLDLADTPPQLLVWHRRLATPGWRRAQRARSDIDAFVDARIQQERTRPQRGAHRKTDADQQAADYETRGAVLPLLVHGRDGDGSGLSDQEIRDQAITMIAAGYETTSAAMGWAVYLLGAHRDWQRRARDEASAVLAGRAPTPADLPRLPLLRAIVNETLRLYPPAMISARYAVADFEHDGRRIRPGDLVIFSPYATHRDPSLYDAPLRFDPQRWLDGPRPAPSEFLPFGGGKHRCLGSGLAVTELTVMLARLLARGSFMLDRPPARARGLSSMRPDPAVTVSWRA